MKKNKIIKFIAAIVICQLAGAIGTVFTSPSLYDDLQKPSFAPPNWLFAPVWITLFTLMGISLYLVLDKDLKNKETKKGLIIFGIQLFLNTLWSFLFFGLKSPFYGLINIIVLEFFIAVTIFQFSKISKYAAMLLIPYIIWVTIATFLNYSIWLLNP